MGLAAMEAGGITPPGGGDGAPRPLFLVVEQDGRIVGCVVRTPPVRPILTRMPEAAIPDVLDALEEEYGSLPAILGPETETRLASEQWAARAGVNCFEAQQLGTYELTELIPPDPWPTGYLRVAGPDDRDLLEEWLDAFIRETEMPEGDSGLAAQRFLEAGVAHLWDDGGAVSLAVVSARTPHGARIGYVYTPPELRGRGLGSAVTAALTARCLEAGMRLCFLFTDLTNPQSNRIYQRLGYRKIGEMRDYVFEP
jgi:RimJ/RimL family protein N-acetyltransferase